MKIQQIFKQKLLNKVSHLIIPATPVIPARDYDGPQCHATWMTQKRPNRAASPQAVNLVRNKAKDSDLMVAFGSGTVNDICKYASYLEGRDYISFPTAASMNEYSSENGSILLDGYKKQYKPIGHYLIYYLTQNIMNFPLNFFAIWRKFCSENTWHFLKKIKEYFY